MPFISKFFGSLVDRIIAAVFAIVFLQFPYLINQYLDALGGALVIAKENYNKQNANAKQFNMTLERYITQFKSNESEIFQSQGKTIQSQVERYRALKKSHDALKSANAFTRPFIFLRHYETKILRAIVFEPGLPLNAEAAIYALFGVVTGMLLYNLALMLIGKIFKKKKVEEAASA